MNKEFIGMQENLQRGCIKTQANKKKGWFSDMSKERLVKVNNEMLLNMVNSHSITTIKILLAMINKLVTKNDKIRTTEGETRYFIKLEDEKYMMTNTGDEEIRLWTFNLLTIEFPLSFIKQYWGSKNLTSKEAINIMDGVHKIKLKCSNSGKEYSISIIRLVEYCNKEKKFKIIFDRFAVDHLIRIYRNFTMLDLEILKQFDSKYLMGLYILYKRFETTGVCVIKLDDFKELLNSPKSTTKTLLRTREAIEKLNKEFGINLQLETIRKGRPIDIIKFTFEPKKARENNNPPIKEVNFNDLQELIEVCEDCGFKPVKGIFKEKLINMLLLSSKEDVLKAIKIAMYANNCNMGYIEGVLRNWKIDGKTEGKNSNKKKKQPDKKLKPWEEDFIPGEE